MCNLRSPILFALLAVSLAVEAGNRSLQTPTNFEVPLASELQMVFAEDFDGDGQGDVLATEVGKLHLLPGLGNGLFGPATLTDSLGYAAEGMADFNADGKSDLYLLGPEGQVAIMLRTSGANFSPPSPVSTSYAATELVAADFTGDGHLDLGILSPKDRKLGIAAGNGNGTFAAPAVNTFPFDPLGVAGDAAAGDFDGDGKVDIAAVSEATLRTVAWNTGTSFTIAELPFGVDAVTAAAADLDGDGITDLITARASSTVVAYGSASRQWNLVTFPTGAVRDGGIVIDDLEEDGHLDIALAGSSVSVLRQDASGFRPVRSAALDRGGRGLAVADFDDDGNPDFVSVFAAELSLVRGSATGELLSHPSFDLDAMAAGIHAVTDAFIGNVNGDGIPDIVAYISDEDRVVVLLGQNDGSFGAPVSTPIADAGEYATLRSADLNGDGRIDLFLSANMGGAWTLLSQSDGTFVAQSVAVGSPFALRDLTGDAKIDVLTWDGSLFPGAGDGTFGASIATGVVLTEGSIRFYGYGAVAEVDGDPLPDLLVRHGSTLHSYLNQGGGTFVAGATTPFASPIHGIADLDGDGRDDILSSVVFLNDGSGGSFTSAGFVVDVDREALALDADGDGRLDVATSKGIFFAAPQAGRFEAAAQTAFGYDGQTILSTADYDHNGSPDLWIFQAGTLTVVPTRKGAVGTAAPQVAVSASPNPAQYSHPYRATATVSGAASVQPRSAVLFTHGAEQPSVLRLVKRDGSAFSDHRSFAVGTTNTITTSFLGDEFYAAASASLDLFVKRGVPYFNASASATHVAFGKKTYITAQLSAFNFDSPTGTVTFLKDGVAFASMPAASSMTVNTGDQSLFPIGTHHVTVEYSGDEKFEPTQAGPIEIVVFKSSVFISLTLSKMFATTAEDITLTATVQESGLGGPIAFSCFGRALGSAPIVNKTASITTRLPWGEGSCVAAYAEDQYHVASSGMSNATIYYAGMPTAPIVEASKGTAAGEVVLRISPITGATAYDLYRSVDGSPMGLLRSFPQYVGTPTDALPNGASVGVYAVVARNGSQTTPMGPRELVAMASFTDDPVVAGGTKIKAIHVSQLQNTVNAVRVAAGLAPTTFAAPTGIISAAHLTSLRTAVTQARAALGLATSFTDPTITPGVTKVRAVHWQELRDAVK